MSQLMTVLKKKFYKAIKNMNNLNQTRKKITVIAKSENILASTRQL